MRDKLTSKENQIMSSVLENGNPLSIEDSLKALPGNLTTVQGCVFIIKGYEINTNDYLMSSYV